MDTAGSTPQRSQISVDKLGHCDAVRLRVLLGEFEILLGQAYGQFDGFHDFSLLRTACIANLYGSRGKPNSGWGGWPTIPPCPSAGPTATSPSTSPRASSPSSSSACGGRPRASRTRCGASPLLS